MPDNRDAIAEAYADWFAENSTDFQADMNALIESLWPDKIGRCRSQDPKLSS